MSRQRRVRGTESERPAERGHSDRWEEKRQRFADRQPAPGRGQRPLTSTFFLTLGGIALAVVFVAVMTARDVGTSPTSASAAALQQVPAATAATAGGRVSISAEEVATKKLVAWDYKQGNNTVPLLAYTTPSGAMKIATRMCEPCNSTSFRVEGNLLVCNACDSRWDLESSRGISGGCQGYPPEVLPSVLEGGKLTVDEQKVATWKPRV